MTWKVSLHIQGSDISLYISITWEYASPEQFLQGKFLALVQF